MGFMQDNDFFALIFVFISGESHGSICKKALLLIKLTLVEIKYLVKPHFSDTPGKNDLYNDPFYGRSLLKQVKHRVKSNAI